jgi:1-acyl-sn-glycerol-3-phosphate acyltransferase
MAFLLLCTAVAVGLLVRGYQSGRPVIEYLLLLLIDVYVKLWHRWSCQRPAPLPAIGPAILISNHTCSVDPAFVLAGSPRLLSYLIAREFYDQPLVRRICDACRCVPVVRNGLDVQAVRLSLRRLQEGCVLCIFPEGGLSTAGQRYRSGKHGLAYIALKSRVRVFPAYIAGGPQISDVAPSWLLPSRGVRVTYGSPIDLSAYYDRPVDRRLLHEVTTLLMRRIISMRPGYRISGGTHGHCDRQRARSQALQTV